MQHDFQHEFIKTYGNARAAHRRGVLAPDLLRLASATLRTACHRLLLPRLKPEARARMAASDIPGVQELMLALSSTLSSFPELPTALSLASDVMSQLQDKDVDLHTAIERATTLVQAAERAERLAGSELKALSTQIIDTTTRLKRKTTNPDAADQAAELLAAVARFNHRIDRSQRRRQLRLRRRLEALSATTPAEDPALQDEDTDPRAQEPTEEIFPEIFGPPLRDCLQAPLPCFKEVKDQLADLCEQLNGEPESGPEDYLYYIELGALLASALQEAPLLKAACEIEPGHLAALCAQADEGANLAQTGQLFCRMAADGHLLICTFTASLYEQATEWLLDRAAEPERAPQERQLLQVEALRLKQVQGRARERLADRSARAQDRVSAAQAEVTAAQQKANLARVKDRLERGLPVDAASFFAAEALQRALHKEDLARTSEMLSKIR